MVTQSKSQFATTPFKQKLWTVNYSRHATSRITYGVGLLEHIDWTTVVGPRGLLSPHFLITDQVVYPLHGNTVGRTLLAQGLRLFELVIENGELSKSLETYQNLSNAILELEPDNHSMVISCGGGVVGNIAGFLAGTVHRGLRFVEVPTTLLAQLDSAVDAKQAINGYQAKNQLGCYHLPSYVFIDPSVLRTLSPRQLAAGLSEALKHAITEDIEFDAFFRLHSRSDIHEPAFLDHVIGRTVDFKAAPLTHEEVADRAEMIGQYGHAIGHALEILTGHDLLHGEAISIGMCVMAEIAGRLGYADDDTVKAHYSLFKRYGLPTCMPSSIATESVLAIVRKDKHYASARLSASLVSQVGKLARHAGGCRHSLNENDLRTGIDRNRNRATRA